MQLYTSVAFLFLFLLILVLILISVSNFKRLKKISLHLGLEIEKEKPEKQQEEAEKNKENSNEAYSNLLVELSEEKQAMDNAPFGTYTFDELDVFDELEHTETDPEKLLKILEYGLPDEELESIIKKLEEGK